MDGFPPPHAKVIGLIGDVHGSATFLSQALNRLAELGAREIHQLGDFGLPPDRLTKREFPLAWLDAQLEDASQVLFVTGGNHEPYEAILEGADMDASALHGDATIPISDRCFLLPRGYRWTADGGARVLSVGGANSIDRYTRQRLGWSWSPLERLTMEQAEKAAAGGRADILLAHDAPRSKALAEKLRPTRGQWEPKGLAYAERGAEFFHSHVFAVTRPKLVCSGHYHLRLVTEEDYTAPDYSTFRSRSVVLDREWALCNIAILDTSTRHVVRYSVREPGRFHG